jgi:hypothetical protein
MATTVSGHYAIPSTAVLIGVGFAQDLFPRDFRSLIRACVEKKKKQEEEEEEKEKKVDRKIEF